MKSLSNRQQVVLLSALILLVKLCLWPFAEVTDADAVSRILYAHEWAKSPHWISDTIWPPAHFYVLGFVYLLNKNQTTIPILVHVIMTWLAFFPVYSWIKNISNHSRAIFTAALFSLSPLVLRLGNLPLAESFLFILCPISFYYLTKPNIRSVDVVKSGLIMSLACSFRYEAWLLSALMGLIFLNKKDWSRLFVFGSCAAIFPVIWMISQHYSTGDFLFGIHGNSSWTAEHMDMHFDTDPEILGRRASFFLFSMLIALGPLPIIFWIIQRKHKESQLKIFLLIALIYLVILTYQAISANLMLHHRFTAGLLILVLPLLSEIDWKKKEFAYTSVILTLSLSLIYPSDGIAPIPRLKNREIVEAVDKCNALANGGQTVLIDFIGWDNTYYGLIYSKSNRTVLIEDKIEIHDIKELLNKELGQKSLLAIVKQGGKLDEVLKQDNSIDIKNSWLSTDQKYFILEIEKK